MVITYRLFFFEHVLFVYFYTGPEEKRDEKRDEKREEKRDEKIDEKREEKSSYLR